MSNTTTTPFFVHISDEDGAGWTTVAIDRASHTWSIAQRGTQLAAAISASQALYLYDDRLALPN